MIEFLILFLHALVAPFKTQVRLEDEIVAAPVERAPSARTLEAEPEGADRLLFSLSPVSVYHVETVIRRHRTGLRVYWRRKSHSRGGQPTVPVEIRRLIRDMSRPIGCRLRRAFMQTA